MSSWSIVLSISARGMHMMLHLGCLVLASLMSRVDEEPIQVRLGERIVFLGDSITQAGVGPTGYVTAIKNHFADKRPDLGVEVFGAGVSGNKVPDLEARFNRDVLAKKPTLVVIYIGINDVWHGEKDPSKGTSEAEYEKGIDLLLNMCRQAKMRVVLCTPSVIGERTDGKNPLDAKLDRYAELSRQAAKKARVPVCDLRKAFMDYLKQHNREQKASGILTNDGVHLTEAGNQLVAETILSALGEK